ncbi:unnamed protein product, partial [marine sediment metagenome]
MCLKNTIKCFFLRKSACGFCIEKETCSERIEIIELVHSLKDMAGTIENNIKKLEGLGECKTDAETL